METTNTATAERTFTTKAALLRHLVEQWKNETEARPDQAEIVRRANLWIMEHPECKFNVATPKDFYATLSNDRARQGGSPPDNGRKPMTFWTDADEEFLANIIVPMRLNDAGPSILELCRKAQEQLPVEKRKVIRVQENVTSLIKRITQKLQEVKKNAELGSQPRVEPKPPPPPPPPPTVEEILASLPDEALMHYIKERQLPLPFFMSYLMEHAVHNWLQTSGHMMSLFEQQSRTLDALLEKIDKLQKVAPTSNTAPKPQQSNSPNLPKPEEDKRVRITVLGLKAEQIQEVHRACHPYAKLNFIDKKVLAPELSPVNDYAVLFVDFIGHGLQNRVVEQLGREKVVLHRGGITGGIATILNLAKTKSQQNGKH